MLTQSFIQMAILTHLALWTGQGLDRALHVATRPVAKHEQKIALTDRPFCEQCAVHSDVPVLLPQNSVVLPWNSDRLLANMEAIREYEARHPFMAFVGPLSICYPPVDKSWSEQFDDLIASATTKVALENGGEGQVIAKKLHLYPQPRAIPMEIEEVGNFRTNIAGIRAALGLKSRIARLTHGWLDTFQLPLEWDKASLRTIRRNESTPPMEEPASYPLSRSGIPSNAEKQQVFSFFVTFHR